ncbi:unnamed protein product, partial [Rotaria sp. Silwood2]
LLDSMADPLLNRSPFSYVTNERISISHPERAKMTERAVEGTANLSMDFFFIEMQSINVGDCFGAIAPTINF